MDPMVLRNMLGAVGGGMGTGAGSGAVGAMGGDPMAALAAMRMRLYGMPTNQGLQGPPGMGPGGLPGVGDMQNGAPQEISQGPGIGPNGSPGPPPWAVGGMRPFPMPEGPPGGLPFGIPGGLPTPPNTPDQPLPLGPPQVKPPWMQLREMGIGGQGSPMGNRAMLAQMQGGQMQPPMMNAPTSPQPSASPAGPRPRLQSGAPSEPRQPAAGSSAQPQPTPPLSPPAQAATQRINSARGYIRDQVRRGIGGATK